MIAWMLWSILFALIIAIGAVASERVAAIFGRARRHVWIVAMVVAALVPPLLAVERAGGGRGAEAPGLAPTQQDARGNVAHTARAAPIVSRPSTLARVGTIQSSALGSHTANTLALVMWAMASLALGLGFARAMYALRRQSSRWPETMLGAHRALLAPRSGPAVIGFWRPRIVLPEWALSLDAHARDLMLRHETEHIRAHDPRTLLGAGLLLVAFPWNAALWLVVRQLRRAMELDCDARVIRAVGGAGDYGMVLLAVGERHSTRLPLAASLASPRPLLEQRISAMTTPRPRRPLLTALPFIVSAVLATVAASRAPRPAPLAPMMSVAPAMQQRPTIVAGEPVVPVATSSAPKEIAPTPATTRPTSFVADAPQAPLSTTPRSRIDRAAVRELIAASHPALVTGEVKATYVVILVDADNNYVWSVPGSGSAMIAVFGDTLSFAERRALQMREQQADGSSTTLGAGGGGRGGRGGGGSGGSGLPSRGGYTTGVMTMSMTNAQSAADGSTPRPAMNQAAGLVEPKGDESGIEGISASQIMYVDTYSFGANELAPSMLRVLIAHLVPGAAPAPDANPPAPSSANATIVSDSIHHATVKTLVILPPPIPRGYQLTACFDVQSNGDARLLQYTTPPDSAYKSKVEMTLKGYKFNPATRLDGTPIRDTVCVHAKATS